MSKTITIGATELHNKRGAVLRQCYRDKTHFIVEKDGLPVVVIIPYQAYRRLFPDPVKDASKK